jgi:hypothetical protein
MEFHNHTFTTCKRASEVIVKMLSLGHEFGSVSVADFYNLCGLRFVPEQDNYGWMIETLRNGNIFVSRTRDGWIIKLPEPVDIRKNNHDSTPYNISNDASNSSACPLNILINTDDLDQPDIILEETFKHIQKIKDRIVNVSIV